MQTIYAEGSTIYEENKFLLNPSSNCKVVSIKANRICAECSCTLEKGTRCYTFNPKGKGRSWVCFSCIPEPNVAETREIGERFGHGVDTALAYYSHEVDSLGRHKTYSQLDFQERMDFDDEREDAIWASMPDDF